MMKSSRDFVAVLTTFSMILVFLLAAARAEPGERPQDPRPRAGKLSDVYLKYLESREERGQFNIMTSEGYSLGATPSHLDFSHLALQEEDEVSVQGLPAYFDLRNKNTLTAVRNQGSCGSCWAFATMGALEAGLMPNQVLDFSEQHLIKKHMFKDGPCPGHSISKILKINLDLETLAKVMGMDPSVIFR